MKYALSLCAALLLLSGSTVLAADEPTITLSGQGVVQAEPDEGYITVGVINVAANSAQAVKDNTETMTALYATLKEQGVTRPNIKTIDFSISENWKQVDRDRRERDGFRVTNLVTVTVCELNTFGKVLDALVRSGANSIQGISFGSSKASELRDEARVLAVKDALRRAELLTKPLGVKVGSVLNISESGSYGRSNMYEVRSMVSAAADVPVSGGTLSFTANVNITWKLDVGGEARRIQLPLPNIGVKPDSDNRKPDRN